MTTNWHDIIYAARKRGAFSKAEKAVASEMERFAHSLFGSVHRNDFDAADRLLMAYDKLIVELLIEMDQATP